MFGPLDFLLKGENAGMIDGFANLTTAVAGKWDDLNKVEQAWIIAKNHQKDPQKFSTYI